MNNIFVTADLHFGHKNVVLHCNRTPWMCDNPEYDNSKPYHFKYNNPMGVNLKSHDEGLIANWNSLVKKGDTVYILGDFAWKNHNHYTMALNGKKIMILGNHDKMSQEVKKNFTEVYDFGVRKRINQQDISLSHYAMRTWASSCHGAWSLFGHSHSRLPEWVTSLSFDVGVDCWNYMPVPWEVIKKKMQIKQNLIKENYIDDNLSQHKLFANSSKELLIKNTEIWKSVIG